MTRMTRDSKAWSRRGLVLALTATLMAPALPAFALAANSSPKAFLEEIYRNYSGNAGLVLDDNTTIRRYFSTGLAHLMIEDSADSKKRNAAPALDGDPFVGHQAWEISDLAVVVKENGPLKATGTVTFINFGEPETVVLELMNAGDGWRIADIAWPKGTLRALYRKK
jgi:hypothetical protein